MPLYPLGINAFTRPDAPPIHIRSPPMHTPHNTRADTAILTRLQPLWQCALLGAHFFAMIALFPPLIVKSTPSFAIAAFIFIFRHHIIVSSLYHRFASAAQYD